MDARFAPIECDCPACRSMCANSTCMPTPDEARALIRSGYAARLACYEPHPDEVHAFVAPAPAGLEGATLRSTHSGACTFYSDRGCELHAVGLKPLEGRLALHDRPWPSVRKQVYVLWSGRRYGSVRALLARHLPPSSVSLPLPPAAGTP